MVDFGYLAGEGGAADPHDGGTGGDAFRACPLGPCAQVVGYVAAAVQVPKLWVG